MFYSLMDQININYFMDKLIFFKILKEQNIFKKNNKSLRQPFDFN